MLAEDLVQAWKGHWRFEPLDVEALRHSPDDAHLASSGDLADLFVDVQCRSPSAASPLRQTLTRARELVATWFWAGSHYVLRGTLHESLRLLEGATVSVQHFGILCGASTDLRCRPGEAVCRLAQSGHIVQVSSVTDAEEFLTPATLQLHLGDREGSVGRAHIRMTFDWKRLHHSCGTAARAVVRWQDAPPLLCVHVFHASGEPNNNAAVADQRVVHHYPFAVLGDASIVCNGIVAKAPQRYRRTALVRALLDDDECPQAPPCSLRALELDSRFCQTTVPLREFHAGVSRKQFCAQARCTVDGQWSVVGLRFDSVSQLYGAARGDLSAPRWSILPVDDGVLAQLSAAHVRYCLARVTVMASHARVDNPVTWSGAQLPLCDGVFSSLSTAVDALVRTPPPELLLSV